MKIKKISQVAINRINLTIAVLALLLSLPSAFNQMSQLLDEHFSVKHTKIIHFSPPPIDTKKAQKGHCWESIASRRSDVARCDDGNNLIYDPCFFTWKNVNPKLDYYYCPTSEILANNGVIIGTTSEDIMPWQPTLMTEENIKKEEDWKKTPELPWMITFPKKITCNIHTGTIEPSFDTQQNIYSCTDEVEVTNNRVENGNYYFNCKFKNKSYYEECLAETVVF